MEQGTLQAVALVALVAAVLVSIGLVVVARRVERLRRDVVARAALDVGERDLRGRLRSARDALAAAESDVARLLERGADADGALDGAQDALRTARMRTVDVGASALTGIHWLRKLRVARQMVETVRLFT